MIKIIKTKKHARKSKTIVEGTLVRTSQSFNFDGVLQDVSFWVKQNTIDGQGLDGSGLGLKLTPAMCEYIALWYAAAKDSEIIFLIEADLVKVSGLKKTEW